MPPATRETTVIVVGAGPIGSLVALQLQRFGVDVLVIDAEDKANAPLYGRACSLWPRSLELYDQLDALEDLLQQGLRNGIAFVGGERATGGFQYSQNMRNLPTACNFSLHLRQRRIEQSFANALTDGTLLEQHSLQSFTSTDAGVSCIVRDVKSGEDVTINGQYLIGADGGRSTVRKLAGIEWIGDRTANKWIRMDALVKTDMPNSRLLNSIDSKSHGQCLWCPIENGRTRIGYVFNAELQQKYGVDGVTAEVAMQEAQKAMAPFSLEFVKLDWHTLYGIGQCTAASFRKGRVLIAGDSAHTHSSGSAQGLNTGTQDAVNLAWKLALVCRGLGTEALLDSYHDERKKSVDQVIANDKIISTLISGAKPPRYAGRSETPFQLLEEFFNDAAVISFTVGLGIAYRESALSLKASGPPVATVLAGQRGPDGLLHRIGTGEQIRLHKLLKNVAKYSVLVFTGRPHHTQSALSALRTYVESPTSFASRYSTELFQWLTIAATEAVGAEDGLGQRPFGRAAWDSTTAVHEIYGIDLTRGGLVLLRPDGWIAAVCPLDQAESLEPYLAQWLKPRPSAK